MERIKACLRELNDSVAKESEQRSMGLQVKIGEVGASQTPQGSAGHSQKNLSSYPRSNR